MSEIVLTETRTIVKNVYGKMMSLTPEENRSLYYSDCDRIGKIKVKYTSWVIGGCTIEEAEERINRACIEAYKQKRKSLRWPFS